MKKLDNIQIISDGLNNSYSFSHDDANQLTSMTGPNGTTGFSYDQWGRLTAKALGGYDASYTYRYGGLLYQGESDFPDEGNAQIQYRGDRKRHTTGPIGSPAAKFDWDAGWNVLGWRAVSNGAVLNKVVADPHSPVNAPAYDLMGGVPFADQMGSTRRLMLEESRVSQEYGWGPYGELRADLHLADGASNSFYRFAGKLEHNNLGMSYFPYRMYDPDISRWMTRDPLGMVDGPHRYGYVVGNPINVLDPMGLYGIPWGQDGPYDYEWYEDLRRRQPSREEECKQRGGRFIPRYECPSSRLCHRGILPGITGAIGCLAGASTGPVGATITGIIGVSVGDLICEDKACCMDPPPCCG